jgi:predicted RNA-binding protein YlxR (DUF448 family)
MPGRNAPTERTCIVSRQALPVDALIRFVVAPDGSVVPDLRRRLPGRGVWVTADAGHVRRAEEKNLFARAFEGPARVEAGLADRVDDLLWRAAVAALSLARKAGSLIAGFAKVEAALAHDDVIALIHASDAGEDGIAKLDAAARRRQAAGKPPVIRAFASADLDLALGRTNVIPAALLAGPASDNLLARIRDLERFRGNGPPQGGVRPIDATPDALPAGT